MNDPTTAVGGIGDPLEQDVNNRSSVSGNVSYRGRGACPRETLITIQLCGDSPLNTCNSGQLTIID